MSFGTGFEEGFGNTLQSSEKSKNSSSSSSGSSKSGGSTLGSEIRKGVSKIFGSGKSGRSMKSSADTASEYSGVDNGMGAGRDAPW